MGIPLYYETPNKLKKRNIKAVDSERPSASDRTVANHLLSLSDFLLESAEHGDQVTIINGSNPLEEERILNVLEGIASLNDSEFPMARTSFRSERENARNRLNLLGMRMQLVRTRAQLENRQSED